MGSITGCTSPMESTYFSGTIGDVHSVIHPRNLSMHVIQACNLIGQVGLDEIVPESPVELFVVLSPVDKGPWKVLTRNFDLRVPP